MQGLSAVSGHRALSAGALLIAAAGLALYQMTSLVLGPTGSRELHLSLSVTATDPEERSESWAASTNVSLGTIAGPTPAAPARAASTASHRASATPTVQRHAPPALPALPASPVPVASLPPTTQPPTTQPPTSQPPTTQPSIPTPSSDGRADSQAEKQHGHGD
jgi:hypothetical protein